MNSNKLGATVAKRNGKLVKLLNGIGGMNLGEVRDHSIDAVRLFVKRNFSRDGKNQAGKALWTVKSRFRGQGCQILFPVFGGEMATAKIQTVKGQSGNFFAPAKKYYSSLDGLDSRNGVKCRLLFLIESGIVFPVHTGKSVF